MKLNIEKFASVVVTPNTTWTFAVISDGEGNSTTVEITAGADSRAVADTLTSMFPNCTWKMSPTNSR